MPDRQWKSEILKSFQKVFEKIIFENVEAGLGSGSDAFLMI